MIRNFFRLMRAGYCLDRAYGFNKARALLRAPMFAFGFEMTLEPWQRVWR